MKHNGFWLGVLVIVFGIMLSGCDLPSADDVGDFELHEGESAPYSPNSLFFKTGSDTWREETYEGTLMYTFKYFSSSTRNNVNGIIIHRTPDDGVRFFVPIIEESNTDFLVKMPNSNNWEKWGIVIHR